MKGFLQRMAANAAGPQSGIHPMVGSIYAGTALAGNAFAERGRAADSIADTEERLIASSPEFSREREDFREGKSDAMRFDIARPEERMGERPAGARRDEPAPFRPLLSNAKQKTAGEKEDTFENEGDESRMREHHYEPLLPHVPHSPAITARVQAAKSDPVSRSAPAEREPDKIEIHIGRIEVTAVPQEAPRPAAARARKSLNLSEYLKRRDGRAG
jgi:hypothetical protein